jgi:hypothetical protein
VEVAPGRNVRVPATVDALESPDGGTRPVVAGETREAPWKAGVYFWRRGEMRVGALVVNGEPAESDLSHLSADSLATRLGGTPVTVAPGDVGRATFAAGGARVLDRTFLLLALALLLAETLVARRTIAKPQEA